MYFAGFYPYRQVTGFLRILRNSGWGDASRFKSTSVCCGINGKVSPASLLGSLSEAADLLHHAAAGQSFTPAKGSASFFFRSGQPCANSDVRRMGKYQKQQGIVFSQRGEVKPLPAGMIWARRV
jgi:hypothetical protein